jgi:ubiquinone/menaquinone biosynthesis C-methylase UbiE
MTLTDEQPTQLTPPQAYEAYYGPAIFQPLAARTLPRADPQPGEHVLDVACGTGILSRSLAAAVAPTGQVVGVDSNPRMLVEAREQAGRAGLSIDFRHGDASALEVGVDAFDLVTCQQGLQFLPDRQAGVTGMRRALRDGGRAVVSVWRGLDANQFFTEMAEAELPHLAAVGAGFTTDDLLAPFSLGDLDELLGLFEAAGFEAVEVEDLTITASFVDADRFVERMEYAYGAVVPAFTEDPVAFATFVERVTASTRELVDAHRRGDRIELPMHGRLVVAR